MERGSGCCAVDSLLHSSLNLAFRLRKLHKIFIFGMAYSYTTMDNVSIPSEVQDLKFAAENKEELYFCYKIWFTLR